MANTGEGQKCPMCGKGTMTGFLSNELFGRDDVSASVALVMTPTGKDGKWLERTEQPVDANMCDNRECRFLAFHYRHD